MHKTDFISLVLMFHLHQKKGFFMPNFFFTHHEADMLYISHSGYSTEYEIKISRSDFKADKKKTIGFFTKEEYLRAGKSINYFYYVTPKGLLKLDELPDYAGLIEIGDSYYDVNYIKNPKRLRKEKADFRNMMFEKSYYRYLDKVLMPSIRKNIIKLKTNFE